MHIMLLLCFSDLPSQGQRGHPYPPVGLLFLRSHSLAEIMCEYLFTILLWPAVCAECDVAVIGTAVKGAAGLFQRPASTRILAPGLCPYPCSRAQPNLLIIPLSNGVNGHTSPQDWREGGRELVRGRDGGRDLNVRSVLRLEIARREIVRWNGKGRHWLAQGGNMHLIQLRATIMDNVAGLVAQFHLKTFYHNRKVQINHTFHWSDVTDMKKKKRDK